MSAVFVCWYGLVGLVCIVAFIWCLLFSGALLVIVSGFALVVSFASWLVVFLRVGLVSGLLLVVVNNVAFVIS